MKKAKLKIELMLLHFKKRRLRWHLIKMPSGRFLLEIFQACPTGKRERGKRELAGGSVYLLWPWNASGLPRRGWRVSLGIGRSGFLFWTSLLLIMNKQLKKEMDMWLGKALNETNFALCLAYPSFKQRSDLLCLTQVLDSHLEWG